MTVRNQLRSNSLFFAFSITQCVCIGEAGGGKHKKKSKCNRGYRWKENGIYS